MSLVAENMSDSCSMRWYAVHTKSRCEKKAEQAIMRRQIYCFLPRIKTWSRRRDRRQMIEVPAFPGYLFVRISLLSSAYHNLITAPGVVGLVRAGDRPIPILDSQIESLHLLVERKAKMRPSSYVTGDQVEVATGPFRGARGIVRRTRSGGRRLVICVEVLHQAVAVEIDDFAVKPT